MQLAALSCVNIYMYVCIYICVYMYICIYCLEVTHGTKSAKTL